MNVLINIGQTLQYEMRAAGGMQKVPGTHLGTWHFLSPLSQGSDTLSLGTGAETKGLSHDKK